jgi:UV DNA damage endonuclease
MTKRIGFACKWIDYPNQVDGISPKDDCKKYNTGATTVAWLNRQTKDKAVEKLWDLVKGNIESTRLLVEKVSKLEENLRMVRLSSDILPVYTEPNWCWFYKQHEVRDYAERHFGRIGDLARKNNVRLSFHPGQFTVLASDNPEIVDRSIEEFEYHVDMARWMGYGKEFQDYKINVHIAGRAGTQGIRAALKRLSPEARNTLTIENEEISYGLTDCLQLSDVVPIVLDIHHHWIREGEYIKPTDDRVKRVIDSWRGVRPACHYSVSREDALVNHCVHTLPDHKVLLESGHKNQKLRAHSDFYWNNAVNEWALSFTETHDIMCESKAKNLASFVLYNKAKELGCF